MKKNTIIQESKSKVLGVLFILVVGFLLGACGGGGSAGPTASVQALPSETLVPIVNQPTDSRKALCTQAGDTDVNCRFPGMQFAASHQKVDSLFGKYQNVQ